MSVLDKKQVEEVIRSLTLYQVTCKTTHHRPCDCHENKHTTEKRNLIDTIADKEKQIQDLRMRVEELELKLNRPFPNIGA